MTEKEFAVVLAENNAGLTSSKAEEVIKSFKRIITNELKRGKDIKLIGLMTLTTRHKEAGKVVDPRDLSKMIQYKAMRLPKARFSHKLKNILK